LNIRIYDYEDTGPLNSWRKARGLEESKEEDLPRIGYTVLDGRDPVACGFLRIGEGIAIIDSLVTNPGFRSDLRDRALNMLFDELLAVAKIMKIDRVIGFSVDEHTICRAEKFGFKQSEHTLMIMEM
jgi:hypothetical protein